MLLALNDPAQLDEKLTIGGCTAAGISGSDRLDLSQPVL
jgi:hypothetical protein